MNRGRTIDDMAEEYDVTPDLVLYRVKITGAHRTYLARQRKRA